MSGTSIIAKIFVPLRQQLQLQLLPFFCRFDAKLYIFSIEKIADFCLKSKWYARNKGSAETACCAIICSGADPGFLERGFICVKVQGFALLILSHFF